jgi:predicted Fe-Mo cluster-binding NifX family protein
MVDDHFGHCEYFTVFTTSDDHKILSEETVQSPAGCGCKSNIVETLSRMGVKMMLAGNMGAGAVNVMNSFGIEVVRGCSGEVRMVVQQWIGGQVKDSAVHCEHDCHHK